MSVLFCQYTGQADIALPSLSIAIMYQLLCVKLSNWVSLVIQTTANFWFILCHFYFMSDWARGALERHQYSAGIRYLISHLFSFSRSQLLGDLFDWLSGELSILCLDNQFLINCDLNKILTKVRSSNYLYFHEDWQRNIHFPMNFLPFASK